MDVAQRRSVLPDDKERLATCTFVCENPLDETNPQGLSAEHLKDQSSDCQRQ